MPSHLTLPPENSARIAKYPSARVCRNDPSRRYGQSWPPPFTSDCFGWRACENRRALLDPDVLLIDLGLDEPCQVSQRLLPTEITGLGWNDVRQACLHDIQLGADRYLLQRHRHLNVAG